MARQGKGLVRRVVFTADNEYHMTREGRQGKGGAVRQGKGQGKGGT